MPSVSPSLVEAAARAVAESLWGDGVWPFNEATGYEVRHTSYATAETVLAAVGDALRLEGAQAEHAHTVNEICDAILARIDASSDYYVNQYSNDVLHAIVEAVRLAGGVTDAP